MSRLLCVRGFTDSDHYFEHEDVRSYLIKNLPNIPGWPLERDPAIFILVANLILKACGMECLQEDEISYLKSIKPKSSNTCAACIVEKQRAREEVVQKMNIEGAEEDSTDGPPADKKPKLDEDDSLSYEFSQKDDMWHILKPECCFVPKDSMEEVEEEKIAKVSHPQLIHITFCF